MSKNTFLVTGASDGIGAVYADRLARRGNNLVLVARRAEKLAALAGRLQKDYGVAVEILPADLGAAEGLATVEARLREDEAITGLVNNAGIAGEGMITELDPAYVTGMINLNILAVTRLSAAIAPRLAAAGHGTIINITSVTALMPAAFTAVYPATKAFVLAFTEALQAQLSLAGVRVQGVLPGITRTAIWEEEKLQTIPASMVMDVEEMVDAALAGLDLGEVLTVPSLREMADLQTFLAARDALRPNLSLAHAAARYGLDVQ
ncbi:short-subunit dehydrogenase [Rhizobium mesoamericanum]|uniref:SDR family NAD(P)-dependent oxidoreductase n=1 Tax=Rhizobium mesoamericanum TaxID=1079800 RepID=UPI002788FD36|nr:SDR family oxidoreductase [Rhizobium mesoamericanum]MDQ0559040.1 short-subunit dehydrogenase [Rhizobium mesoamericanum]